MHLGEASPSLCAAVLLVLDVVGHGDGQLERWLSSQPFKTGPVPLGA